MDASDPYVSLQELTKENNEKTVLIEQKKLMECKKKVTCRVVGTGQVGVPGKLSNSSHG